MIYYTPMRMLWAFLFGLMAAFAQDISPGTYQKKLVEIRAKVPAFQWLAERARHHRVKVWLFGGSASSFAHYVKENMLFEQGLDEYYESSFRENARGERDYLDIFRPAQDIDLVVDGYPRQIEAFQMEVMREFPELLGEKKRWEVRALRADMGEKLALLNNPNFFKQHTDSHSVGLIALDSQERVVRDLLDWDSPEPRFLHDVLNGRLSYYFNSQHHETSRFKRGLNPEILSVIRYFTKLFQFELEMNGGDMANLKAVIQKFLPVEVTQGYVQNWFEHNVPKLFLHSRNVEYAWDTLEAMGLREKLSQVGNRGVSGSPAWWMSKSPLRSFEVGRGSGKTAEELGIIALAHDTSDFFTWSVITRSRKGEANVFASQPGIPGERAVHGRGFYTLKNSRVGLWKTGFTIRVSLDSLAREGADFHIFGNIVVVLNKKAIRVIPESLKVDNFLSYFYLLKNIGDGDRALLAKAKRRMKSIPLMQEDIDGIVGLLKESDHVSLWKEWFALGIYRDHATDFSISAHKGTLLHWATDLNDGAMMEYLLDHGADVNARDSSNRTPLASAAWQKHYEAVRVLIKRGADINREIGFTGTRVLNVTVMFGELDMVQILIAGGADIGEGVGHYREWPLHQAVRPGSIEKVRLLVNLGADINVQTVEGLTPLHYAARFGLLDITQFLVERGADINRESQWGGALHYAARDNHLGVAQFLIEAKANLDARGKFGRTPLGEAIIGHHFAMIELLIQAGADVRARDDFGISPLDDAKHSSDVRLQRLFAPLKRSCREVLKGLMGRFRAIGVEL